MANRLRADLPGRTTTHRRATRLIAILLASVLALAGCGNSPQDEVTETPSPSPTKSARPAPTPSASQTPSVEPSPEPSPSPSDLLPEGVITALVLGTDSRSNDWGGLADTIIVVQLSEDRQQLNLVSITRDSYVEIPGYGRGKINSAFGRGGIPLMKQTVSNLLGGLEIDFVVQTNFNGFIALTRAMDGFTVDNQHANRRTVASTGRVVEFPEGDVKLENTDGLIYVRERKGLPRGDLDRAERGRAALVGMMRRLVEITEAEPAQLAELLPMIYRNVKVDGDVKLEHLPALIDVGRNFRDGGEVNSLMVPIAEFGTVNGASVNVLDSGRTTELGAGLRNGDLRPYVAKYGESYAPTGKR